jgi:Flp pilus assembly protein TadG
MMKRQPINARRGAVLLITATSMMFLMGFAALAIDIGHAYAVKAQLQKTADAAALAGIAAMTTNDALSENFDVSTTISSLAAAEGDANLSNNMSICGADIVFGHITDPDDLNETIDTTNSDYNAVQVSARRTDSCNGGIDTLLAKVMGTDSMNITVSATAFFDDRFSGFLPPQASNPLTPFAISRTYYEQQLAAATDTFAYSTALNGPIVSTDGVREIRLYPEDNNSNGNGNNGNGGGGNFGTLNIGIGNQGTNALSDQILDGVTRTQMNAEIGSETVEFYDTNGNAVTHTISGNPGISAGLKHAVDQKVGDVIGFFIHEGITGNGANATYQISDIRFGIVMEVDLTGSPSNKRIVVQPIVYSGDGIVIDENAPSSDGLVASVRLIR